jgi:hypothetical protein
LTIHNLFVGLRPEAAKNAPTIPRIVVRVNPDGSFLPGVTNFAITPAMNPMMIVQMMCMASSP